MSKSYRELKDSIAEHLYDLEETRSLLKKTEKDLEHCKAELRLMCQYYEGTLEQLSEKGLIISDLVEELRMLREVLKACGYTIPLSYETLDWRRQNVWSNNKTFCKKFAAQMHQEYIQKVQSGGFRTRSQSSGHL